MATHAMGSFNAHTLHADPTGVHEHRTQGRDITLHNGNTNPFPSRRNDYPAYDIAPRQANYAPNQQHVNGAPFTGTSLYKEEYPAHHIEPRAPYQGAGYVPSSQPFDGTTSNKTDYPAYDISPMQRSRPAAPPRQNAPFEGSSMYKDEFKALPMEPRHVHQPAPYQPNSAPFTGTSQYKDQFQGHPGLPQQSAKPPQQPMPSAPFTGEGHYKADYQAHQIEPRERYAAAPYQPNSAPFQGSTAYKDEFKAHPMEPYQRNGPPQAMRPVLPFEGSSTNKEAFQGWQLPARRPALGVHLHGDRNHILIPADAPLPAVGKQIFTTVHNDQEELSVVVLRGDAPHAMKNGVLGSFDLRGLPPGPKSTARIEVTFHLDENNVLTASALDLDHARQEEWLKHGAMVAQGGNLLPSVSM